MIEEKIDEWLQKKPLVINRAGKNSTGNVFIAAKETFIKIVQLNDKDYRGYDPYNYEDDFRVERFATKYSKILDAGEFARQKIPELSLKNKRYAQENFDNILIRNKERSLREEARKLRSTLVTVFMTFLVVGALLVWAGVSWYHTHQDKVAQTKFISTNNTESRVTVDNTFSFLMPCSPNLPSGHPTVSDSTDLKTTEFACTQEDSMGSFTISYTLENEVYKTNKYSPQDFYNNCNNNNLLNTNDTGEQFLVIDNHIENVHGIDFAICDTSGNRGTEDIIAKAVRGNTLQYFWQETDIQHVQNTWLKFRGYLESFNYVN